MKAIIFDMDGVIVDSESVWQKYEPEFLPELLGKDVYEKMRDKILGNSVSGVYAAAKELGFSLPKKELEKAYDRQAEKVYKEAALAEEIEDVITTLRSLDLAIGLVSSSRQYWIDMVLSKFSSNPFAVVLSLDGENIRPKPFPDGYLLAMKKLDSTPKQTVIVEDTKRGIDAAKKSGAFTVCLMQYVPVDRVVEGADEYIQRLSELPGILEKL